jgi:hypothetical protein
MTSNANVRARPMSHASTMVIESSNDLSETTSHLDHGVSCCVVDSNPLKIAKVDDESTILSTETVRNIAMLMPR